MVANHYPTAYGSSHHWPVLLVFSLAAVGIVIGSTCVLSATLRGSVASAALG
jgi:uncharacterized membrane protein